MKIIKNLKRQATDTFEKVYLFSRILLHIFVKLKNLKYFRLNYRKK